MRIAAIVVLLLCVPVLASKAESVDAIQARQEKIDRFVWDGPVFIKDKSLTTLRKLGPLKNELVEKEVNRHDPTQTTEYRTFQFDGLKIYGFMRHSHELSPILITVTSARWKILHGLNVGSQSTHIVGVLGQPDEKTNNVLTYHGETETVNFHVSGSEITKVEFIYYAD